MAPSEPPALPGFDVLYDGAACGLLLTDRDGTIRRVNRTFCEWVGMAPEELVDKLRFQDLLTVGGRIFHQTHWAPLLQIQGSVAEVKLDLAHRDGSVFPAVLNALSREHGGTVFHELALFAAHDRHAYERELMQARKQAEALLGQQTAAQDALAMADAQLRMALETARLHVWEMDPATGERTYAPSVALLLGMDRPQPVSTRQYLAAVDKNDLPAARSAFAGMMDGEVDVYRCVYRLNGVDGVQRTVLATARTLRSAPGEAMRVFGLIQDITELNRQRAVAEDRALFAEQMMGIVSHDLRNPLQTIVLCSDWLETVSQEPRQQRTVAHMKRAAERAQRMIGDLLDFTMARVGQGLSVLPECVDLRALIAEQVNELKLAYPETSLVHAHSGEGFCMADADRLCQLVGNLVANASTYGELGGTVTVTSAIEPEQFMISVHNRGPAIDEDLLPSLFRPMVRGGNIHDGVRSVGLGLYIVHEIARAHGGQVRVASSDADGTTFTAVFPRRDGGEHPDMPGRA